ncbi:MAG: hypothetical protein K8R53_16150 [Bacteroidales bacterium]|nr:hypothetical protein [Bacteroidales bacterium]
MVALSGILILVLVIILFFLCAITELLIYSVYNSNSDRLDNQNSLLDLFNAGSIKVITKSLVNWCSTFPEY